MPHGNALHPALELFLILCTVMNTVRGLVMALVAQPHGQAIAVTGLAVCPTKYMVAFEVCGFAAKIAAAAAGVKNRFH